AEVLAAETRIKAAEDAAAAAREEAARARASAESLAEKAGLRAEEAEAAAGPPVMVVVVYGQIKTRTGVFEPGSPPFPLAPKDAEALMKHGQVKAA
ncbi:MAG TPA: hypothetical protein PLS69_08985, partial [Terricaulis sp.]|nr:hypothetical protein [Terricaulis sp.]